MSAFGRFHTEVHTRTEIRSVVRRVPTSDRQTFHQLIDFPVCELYAHVPQQSLCDFRINFSSFGKKNRNRKGKNCLLTLDDGMKLVQIHGNVFEAEETMGLKCSKWPQRH